MKPKTAALLGLAGLIAGSVLRFFDFYFYYDVLTGLQTNNGLFSSIGLGLMGLVFLLCFVFALKNRQVRTAYTPSRCCLRGFSALAAAGGAMFAAWYMYQHLQTKGIGEISTTGLSMRAPFMVATFILGLYLIFTAVMHFFAIEELLKRLPVLELIPAVWGLLLILYVFIHYSVSVLVPENVFLICSACALTYALMNKAKYMGGVDNKGLGLARITVAATLAFMLYGAYFFSDAVLIAVGATFTGGLPFAVQTVTVLMSMHVMVFLLTAQWQDKAYVKEENHAGQRFR